MKVEVFKSCFDTIEEITIPSSRLVPRAPFLTSDDKQPLILKSLNFSIKKLGHSVVSINGKI